jgi:hypothetical protein
VDHSTIHYLWENFSRIPGLFEQLTLFFLLIFFKCKYCICHACLKLFLALSCSQDSFPSLYRDMHGFYLLFYLYLKSKNLLQCSKYVWFLVYTVLFHIFRVLLAPLSVPEESFLPFHCISNGKIIGSKLKQI